MFLNKLLYGDSGPELLCAAVLKRCGILKMPVLFIVVQDVIVSRLSVSCVLKLLPLCHTAIPVPCVVRHCKVVKDVLRVSLSAPASSVVIHVNNIRLDVVMLVHLIFSQTQQQIDEFGYNACTYKFSKSHNFTYCSLKCSLEGNHSKENCLKWGM